MLGYKGRGDYLCLTGVVLFGDFGHAAIVFRQLVSPQTLTKSRMNLLVSLLLLMGGVKSAEKSAGVSQKGKATYYASKFAGRMTSFGERVNLKAFTAAHRTLPLNTLIEVTNLKTMKSVVVRVNDRGPFTKGHIVDLSHAAASAIGLMGKGVTNVTLRVLDKSRVGELMSVLTVPDMNQSLMQPVL